MKVTVSVFEKLLVSIITFVFSALVLIQIMVNNNILDTIKANEEGTPVNYQESSIYISKGTIEFKLSDYKNATILVNGEEIEIEKGSSSHEAIFYDGDVIEIVNSSDSEVSFYVVNSSKELEVPIKGSIYKCKKGITYLYKVKAAKIS